MTPAPTLFFGTGSGRCGTMLLANLLNAEPGARALHEGKIRTREEAGEQHLPFLTLQNYRAYCHPEEAEALLRKTRAAAVPEAVAALTEGAGTEGTGTEEPEAAGTGEGPPRLFGDIAYNYAPFVHVLPAVFPQARLIVLHRDGRDFVRSAWTAEEPDPAPVGWPAPGRRLTRTERYIALGRLRPRPGTDMAADWPAMDPVARNAWLWAETNRLILDGLEAWAPERVRVLRFDAFTAGLPDSYAALRGFLGLEGPVPAAAEALMARPVNARTATHLPPWRQWDDATSRRFWRYAGDMMDRLGYGERR